MLIAVIVVLGLAEGLDEAVHGLHQIQVPGKHGPLAQGVLEVPRLVEPNGPNLVRLLSCLEEFLFQLEEFLSALVVFFKASNHTPRFMAVA